MSVIVRDEPFIRLPIYYLQPHELVCMAVKMGEKRWAKCEEAGKKRRNPHVRAVALGAEVRLTLRRPEDMPEMRPPAEWLAEAGITPGALRDTVKMLRDD